MNRAIDLFNGFFALLKLHRRSAILIMGIGCWLLGLVFYVKHNVFVKAAFVQYQAMRAYQNKDYGTAEIYYLSLTEAGLSSPRSAGLAAAYYKQGRYEEALNLYQSMLNADGAQVLVLSHIGNCYFKLGHLDKSLRSYQKAFLLDTNDVRIRENMMLVWNKLILKQQGSPVKETAPIKPEPRSVVKTAVEQRHNQTSAKAKGNEEISEAEVNEILEMVRRKESRRSGSRRQKVNSAKSNGPQY